MRHAQIDTEHLLLGLLLDQGGIAGKVLRGLGLDIKSVSSIIEGITGIGEHSGDALALSRGTQSVLELAVEEARNLSHNYIGVEHILLGLVTYEKGVANDVVSQLGLTPEQIREQTLGVMEISKGIPKTDLKRPSIHLLTNRSLIFLKLGGSLITDKHSPRTPRLDVIDRISTEIAVSLAENPELRIILGHGSGSFGHTSAKKHGTMNGVHTKEEWIGFAEVWQDAASLNQIVVDALLKAKIPAIKFPPSACVSTQDREIVSWNIYPIISALENAIVPVIFGDVVFDRSLGGTILSTEDLFVHLALLFNPGRILLAGIEPGVWEDYPENKSIFSEITPADLASFDEIIKASGAPDVTGGMASKVKQMIQLTVLRPSLKTLIFSGEKPGLIKSVLAGETSGTVIHK
jgi:isopentenyl phosphate kinase